jgi:hypothetical protein
VARCEPTRLSDLLRRSVAACYGFHGVLLFLIATGAIVDAGVPQVSGNASGAAA